MQLPKRDKDPPLKSCQSRDQSLATNEASVLVRCPAENSVLSWSGDPALELSWRASLVHDWRQNPKGTGGASRAGLGRMPGRGTSAKIPGKKVAMH